jgi:hypothetical protein
MAVLGEIFRQPFGKQNVPGVAAVHYALCNVDASACDV